MNDVVLAVLLLLAAGCAAWLLADLRPVPRWAAHTGASVSGVIPARNEATTLPAVLASLRALPLTEVVVVDDASSDDTAAVARAGGATVVTATPPPAGWTGKAWACQLGADATTGDHLLFIDADTVLEPDALAGVLALHGRGGGLVSVQPHHRVERAYEQLSSYFNVMALMASGAFTGRAVHRPMAFGPCLFTTRADYEAVGGHGAVRGEILDDVELAAAYAREGLPVLCAVGADAIRMRSYPGGLRQLADGWTKNFASGAAAAAPGPALAAGVWISAHHAVAVGAFLTLVGAGLAATTGWSMSLLPGSPLLWAIAWVLAAVQLRWILRRVGTFTWWTWAFFPVCLVAFDVIFARSVLHTALRRSVQWRGREVVLGATGGGALMLRLLMPRVATVALDVVAQGVVHATTGYAAHRLVDERLRRPDGWLLRERDFESGGRWYRERLQIHRWKDRLPEAGALFRGGVSKRELPSYDVAGLELFVRETRRAELGHWWAMGCSPVFVLWNPPVPAALLVAYGVGINLPFIAIQRYNRFRTQAIIGRLSR